MSLGDESSSISALALSSFDMGGYGFILFSLRNASTLAALAIEVNPFGDLLEAYGEVSLRADLLFIEEYTF